MSSVGAGLRQLGRVLRATSRPRRWPAITRRLLAGRLWTSLPQPVQSSLAWQLMPLQLNDLYQKAELWTDDPARAVAELLGVSSVVPDDLQRAYETAVAEIAAADGLATRRYPAYYDISNRSQRAVYLLVRHLRPTTVLETGIADGRSTAIILAALEANGHGFLHSVDIADDVGSLVPSRHVSWRKHITSGTNGSFSELLDSLPPIDLFIHDGDHSYGAQWHEYTSAWAKLSSRGVLASDDVNWSNAFLDFCSARDRRPVVLADVNKVFGFLRKKS